MTGTLLSRLQSATGPSIELDAEIALANGWLKATLHGDRDSPDYWLSPTGQICPQPPEFTKYIEIALMLMPEGLLMSITIWLGIAVVRIRTGSIVDPATKEWEGSSKATPALALLIAIHKAKEESKP